MIDRCMNSRLSDINYDDDDDFNSLVVVDNNDDDDLKRLEVDDVAQILLLR